MTHSPGPWLFNPSTGYIRTETPRPNFPHGQVIAKVMSGPGKRAAENAALIIAAEELLAALKHARSQMLHPDQMIDDAIAKATGGVA